MSVAPTEFSHAENGLSRFPPNVEQITVKRESCTTWLVVRRNDVELRFPMSREDRQHLAKLLTSSDPASAESDAPSP